MSTSSSRHIELIGVKDTQRVETYFASSLVDIAYILSVSGNRMKVVPDVGVDLGNSDDLEWLIELLVDALADCKEMDVGVEVHL